MIRPPAPVPAGVEVHSFALDATPDEAEALSRLLAPEERIAIARLHRPIDRLRRIAARGRLRRLLAGMLGCDPAGLVFRRGPHGKPELADPAGTGLHFNLADSEDRALVVITQGRPVGVDLERHRPGPCEEGLAERVFHPAERAALRGLPPERRRAAFFAVWTRKEAYLKARGTGLSVAPDSFALPADDGPVCCRLPDGWTLVDLDAGPGWAASLCFATHGGG